MPIHLAPQGYFHDGQKRIIPIGANYWPASVGVEMWQKFPGEEIRHDLATMKSLGLNCLRFFLRWQDFEPEPGVYDEAMFDKLRQILRWCQERAIWAHPSLFVGFMSGGTFWPKWKNDRNLYADPQVAARSLAFARRATEVIAEFKDTVIAIDHGNEMCCLKDSFNAPPAAVITWCQAINEVIRSVWPDALTISGNEQNQFLNDSGWRFGQQPGCSMYSMHAYPVEAWHNVRFDGLTDPFCHTLLPFYTKVARAFGPVWVQEFGTIVTFGKKQQDTYLRAILPACWKAGANGFLWWCLRDITAPLFPYTQHGFEGTLGLIDSNDKVKPGLEYYLEFAKSLATLPEPQPDPAQPVIGLYAPKHFYNRDNPAALNNPGAFSKHLIVANHLLTTLGYETRIVRGDQNLPEDLTTLLIPSVLIGAEEVPALRDWVSNGGNLLWHGPDPVNWGPQYIELLGAKPVDYRLRRDTVVALGGKSWKFGSWPRGMRVEVMPETAAVWGTDEESRLPVILHHRVGKGRVIAVLPQVEDSIASQTPNHGHWSDWYAAILQKFQD